MSIVTFYSYKGGVGRSMAMANVSVELAKMGKKVLMVDWDLEAPGLERYFINFIDMDSIGGGGLLPMLLDVKSGQNPNYNNYLWKINIESDINTSKNISTLYLLSSGKNKDDNYSKTLETFEWKEFFSASKGGFFLESLRNKWKEDFDFVLIDSRTGLSDTSGICTILLPDIIIPMFTANSQSLYGIRDICRMAQEARSKLDVDRFPLTICPIPSRFGTRVEFKESQKWLDLFAEELKEFYSDWLPLSIKPRLVLEKLKIPHIDYFSFGEKLAVIEQGTNDPEGLGYIYSKIAALLSLNFVNINGIVGEDYNSIQTSRQDPIISDISSGYEYDIYISYKHGNISNEWLFDVFLPLFTSHLEGHLGYQPNMFIDKSELKTGVSWPDYLHSALARSKIMIAILTPAYFSSEWCVKEYLTMSYRQEEMKKHNFLESTNSILLPFIKQGPVETFHSYIKEIQVFDYSKYNRVGDAFKRSDGYLEIQERLEKDTEKIAMMIKKVPLWSPDFIKYEPIAESIKIKNHFIKV